MSTKQAATYSSCLLKADCKLKLLFTYSSRWPVQDIRHCVMFRYQYLILANHCHTAFWTVKLTVAQQATVLFYRHQCCFNKQLSNKHNFTALSYFPLYHRTLCQYTYTTYLNISCPVRHWSHHKAVPSLSPPYQHSLYSATLLLSVATPQSLCSQNNTKWPTCFDALHKTSVRKAVILLLRPAVLSRGIGICG